MKNKIAQINKTMNYSNDKKAKEVLKLTNNNVELALQYLMLENTDAYVATRLGKKIKMKKTTAGKRLLFEKGLIKENEL